MATEKKTVRLSQKRNCEGCRALNVERGAPSACGLGFDNRGPYIAKLGIYRLEPQEPCYKPMTYSQLFEATDLTKKLDRNEGRTRSSQ